MEVIMCQKIVNVLAVSSFAISGALVGSCLYVYVNRDSIIDGVKSQIMESVTGSLGASLAGGALIPELGSDISSGGSSDQPDLGIGVPTF